MIAEYHHLMVIIRSYMDNTPEVIMICIRDYTPSKQWFGVIYQIDRHILRKNTELFGVDWNAVYDIFNSIGLFRIKR